MTFILTVIDSQAQNTSKYGNMFYIMDMRTNNNEVLRQMLQLYLNTNGAVKRGLLFFVKVSFECTPDGGGTLRPIRFVFIVCPIHGARNFLGTLDAKKQIPLAYT